MEPDQQARFTELYLREQPTVLRFVARRLPASDLTRAEDLTQDAFITAWRCLSQVPVEPAEARAWLFAVARNALLHEHRSLVRRGALAVRIADHAEQTVPSPADGVADLVDLAAAWHRLDPGEQEVIALATWENLTAAQAGRVLGISAANYRVRLHRARSALRQALVPNRQPDQMTVSATQPVITN